MEIGSKLKHARNHKGLTQEHAAEICGVSRQTISNWENNKSYPDIISVIKMSDAYSISLDHLLKEEKSMKQTYHEFLEESTNTVKAKRRLGEIILLSTYFLVWVISMVVFWQVKGPLTSQCDMVFRWILLPLVLLVATIFIAKNNDWGKGKWFSVLVAAITYLAVPYTNFMEASDTATYTFRFPTFGYMLIGIVIAVCGITIGSFWNRKIKES
ncbi:MAG: helix-turn-helix domain-containing protein [Firmicutes bacterium]|nr:helix-turn-helix domain-containing protein [Bacillota bacterium]